MNVADSEARAVLGPAGNKAQRSVTTRKSKPLRKVEKSLEEVAAVAEENNALPSSTVVASLSLPLHSVRVPSVLRRQEQLLHSNFSLNASCSSDASSDSYQSRASTGRIYRTSSMVSRRRQLISKSKIVVPDGVSEFLPDGLQPKKRCAWVTSNTGRVFSATLEGKTTGT
ncbi:hypothetical protein F0562_009291 [Nyssa sinensis]|uniref:Uncharacterized protein n=1 Tax=Nyssa sinensis TaxID=561372 RepID=A0A5J4ZYQ5_9ASTE|nr:hypothetical protein F0562_009291 [Nyssa sinensis]